MIEGEGWDGASKDKLLTKPAFIEATSRTCTCCTLLKHPRDRDCGNVGAMSISDRSHCLQQQLEKLPAAKLIDDEEI